MMFSKRQFKYAVGRPKKVNDKMQNDRLIQSILRFGSNIFKGIKKTRGNSSSPK